VRPLDSGVWLLAALQQCVAAEGHHDAHAAALVSAEARFEQAGIITTRGLGELVEATALLATQPVPAGGTVAIVSKVGAAGRLAARACTSLGLTVHRPRGVTRNRLRALVPRRGAVDGPVDMTATVSGADFRQCLELLAADEEVQAMIAIVLPTAAAGDLVTAIQQAASQVPAYCYPEAAVAAVARAAQYGTWRAEPRGEVPALPDVRTADARALVREFLRGAGRRLAPGRPAGRTAALLRDTIRHRRRRGRGHRSTSGRHRGDRPGGR
jgi:acyl-CoA synthetase (NDP forming)